MAVLLRVRTAKRSLWCFLTMLCGMTILCKVAYIRSHHLFEPCLFWILVMLRFCYRRHYAGHNELLKNPVFRYILNPITCELDQQTADLIPSHIVCISGFRDDDSNTRQMTTNELSPLSSALLTLFAGQSLYHTLPQLMKELHQHLLTRQAKRLPVLSLSHATDLHTPLCL
jgi:hypothetical protein